MVPISPIQHLVFSLKASNRRKGVVSRSSSSTTIVHAAAASDVSAAVTFAFEEPGRTHSYLPYTNHPPDISKARDHKLYVEDEPPTKSLTAASHHQYPLHSSSFLTDHDGWQQQQQQERQGFSSASLTDLQRLARRGPSSRRRRVTMVAIVLVCVILLGAMLAFICWPRTPKIRLAAAGRRRQDEDWGPDQQHPWLRTLWLVNVTLDNRENFVPTRILRLDLVMSDQVTRQAFASSSARDLTLMPRTDTMIQMLFDVNYETPSVSDPTFEHLYSACGPQKISAVSSPTLNITLQVMMSYPALLKLGIHYIYFKATFEILGIAWKPTIESALPNGFRCPNS